MRRSPSDAREPKDQRLLIFLLLSASIVMFTTSLSQKPVEKPVDQAKQQADELANDEGGKLDGDNGADAGEVAGDDEEPSLAEGDKDDAPPIEVAPDAPPQMLTIGSAAADSPYRMLLTLSNEGAVVQRLSLSSNEFSDIENRSGSLGALDLVDAPGGGALLQVVPPGTAADAAGLKTGDVILSGAPVGKSSRLKPAEFANAQALKAWMGSSRPRDKVTLKIAANPESNTSAREATVTLSRPQLQVIRPESENVLQFQDKLPEGFKNVGSMIVWLSSVNGLEADSPKLRAANRRLRSAPWTVEKTDDGSAEFVLRLADLGLEVVKRFSVAQVPEDQLKTKHYPGYHFDFEVEVRNLQAKPQMVVYELQGPNGLPIEGFWYANKIGRNVNGSGSWGAVGLRDVIARYKGGPVSQMSATGIADDKYGQFGQSGSLAYIGVDAQFFSTMMIPKKESLDEVLFDYGNTRLATSKLDDKVVRSTWNNPTFTLTSKSAQLAAAGEDEAAFADSFTVFAGPKRPELLAEYYPAEAKDYSLKSILYYGWFGPVAKVMLGLLHLFYSVVRNYGVAIILLTVVVRLGMFPLSRKQAINMVKMQELKPEIDRIAEKYKTDMEKRTKAQQDLFKKHNYNPMGGCLLMFVQLPIFLGLYRALSVDVELREASLFGRAIQFCSNLAAPDMFYDWSRFMPQWFNNGNGIFALGPYFNLLPILTIVLFLLQQKMFMPAPTNEQAVMQQKMMKYMMVFMGFMFFKVPSGLCLYFIASSLWGISERKMIPPPKPSEEAMAFSKPAPPKKPTGGAAQQSRKKKRRK